MQKIVGALRPRKYSMRAAEEENADQAYQARYNPSSAEDVGGHANDTCLKFITTSMLGEDLPDASQNACDLKPSDTTTDIEGDHGQMDEDKDDDVTKSFPNETALSSHSVEKDSTAFNGDKERLKSEAQVSEVESDPALGVEQDAGISLIGALADRKSEDNLSDHPSVTDDEAQIQSETDSSLERGCQEPLPAVCSVKTEPETTIVLSNTSNETPNSFGKPIYLWRGSKSFHQTGRWDIRAPMPFKRRFHSPTPSDLPRDEVNAEDDDILPEKEQAKAEKAKVTKRVSIIDFPQDIKEKLKNSLYPSSEPESGSDSPEAQGEDVEESQENESLDDMSDNMSDITPSRGYTNITGRRSPKSESRREIELLERQERSPSVSRKLTPANLEPLVDSDTEDETDRCTAVGQSDESGVDRENIDIKKQLKFWRQVILESRKPTGTKDDIRQLLKPAMAPIEETGSEDSATEDDEDEYYSDGESEAFSDTPTSGDDAEASEQPEATMEAEEDTFNLADCGLVGSRRMLFEEKTFTERNLAREVFKKHSISIDDLPTLGRQRQAEEAASGLKRIRKFSLGVGSSHQSVEPNHPLGTVLANQCRKTKVLPDLPENIDEILNRGRKVNQESGDGRSEGRRKGVSLTDARPTRSRPRHFSLNFGDIGVKDQEHGRSIEARRRKIKSGGNVPNNEHQSLLPPTNPRPVRLLTTNQSGPRRKSKSGGTLTSLGAHSDEVRLTGQLQPGRSRRKAQSGGNIPDLVVDSWCRPVSSGSSEKRRIKSSGNLPVITSVPGTRRSISYEGLSPGERPEPAKSRQKSVSGPVPEKSGQYKMYRGFVNSYSSIKPFLTEQTYL